VKYQLTRNDIRPSYPGKPLGWVPDEMKDFVETREVYSSGRVQPITYWRTDVVFDNEYGPASVQGGFAVPMDDECREASNRTPAQIAVAQHAYARTAAGIDPEDFEAYEKGYMTGYLDGEWIPGPNYAEWEALQKELEDEDDV
jgi:hypothetical protein